VDVGSLGDQ